MYHEMKLNQDPFYRIKSGKKKIEIRLFDEKRQKLKVGDKITFFKLPELNEKTSAEIIELKRYKTFKDLVEDFPMSYFGYSDEYNKDNFVNSIYMIYTKGQEERQGVLGIKIKLI